MHLASLGLLRYYVDMHLLFTALSSLLLLKFSQIELILNI